MISFDVCPVCVNMKFGHLLHLLKERQAIT